MTVVDRMEVIPDLICPQTPRGTHRLMPPVRDDLAAAARELHHREGPVFITTGFVIPTVEPPQPETDGPAAAAIVGAFLADLGRSVVFVTDEHCVDIVAAAAAAVHLDAEVTTSPPDVTAPGATVVAIERPGPGSDGRLRSMRGVLLPDDVPDLSSLVLEAGYSVGIGDGGNEIGMGRILSSLIASSVERGALVATTTATSRLIVAAVSHWGALGLICAMAVSEPDCVGPARRSLDPQTSIRALEATVRAGAIDGVTELPNATIDGMPAERTNAVLRSLTELLDP